MLDVILQTKAEVEALSAQAGLKIIHLFLEQEIEQRWGRHGQQNAYQHGTQPGYVVYGGRKVSIKKPRISDGPFATLKLPQLPLGQFQFRCLEVFPYLLAPRF
jgi:hypothetical protein